MPPMSGMPPPAPPPSLSWISATIASVVRMFLAIEAAFCSAERVTMAGSMTPSATRSTISPVAAFRPKPFLALRTSLTTTEPSWPAFSAIWRRGSSSERRAMRAPVRSSSMRKPSSLMASAACSSATPPPGTMPSSRAARVAWRASSTRCFFSFISVSVAAPTFTTATPPESLARRSWSFSRSKSESVFSTSALIWLMRPRIASASPLPSTMVVVSFVTTTRRARPSCETCVFSSLRPISSVMTSPPERIAMSSSMRLRRSPKPGALTATPVNVPRSLFTTRVARASPSTSSAMSSSGFAPLIDPPAEGREALTLDVLGEEQQRLARLNDLLEDREQVPDRADLLVGDEDVRILEDGLHAVLVGDHVRADVALVELHALGELEVHAERLALLDVDHAVLADPVDGVGDDVADLLVGGGDGRHAGDLLLAGDLGRLLADRLDDLLDRRLDAALERERVGPRGDVLQAVADDGLRQDGRGGGAVTGHVVGGGGHLAHQLGALVLEDVLDLDLARDGHAVVRNGRGAELLVEDYVAALGAERDLDCVGNRVDALLERLAGIRVVLELLVSHVPFLSLALDLGQHVGLAQDEEVLALDLDFGAAVLGVKELVALGDVKRDPLAGLLTELAVSDGQDLALLGLFLRRVGEDDAARGRLLLLDRLDDQTIAEGLELHRGPP